jgi:hypothetical protein
MDDATRAERRLGDAIGRYISEAIDAGFQPPRHVSYVSVSGAAGVTVNPLVHLRRAGRPAAPARVGKMGSHCLWNRNER